MSLRNRLLALALLTLLLPWSGWKLLQELERFLRQAQAETLLSTARSLAGALPFELLSSLRFEPQRYLVVAPLPSPPLLDGFTDDWPDPGQGVVRSSADGAVQGRLLVGRVASDLFLALEVQHAGRMSDPHSGIELRLRSPTGNEQYSIRPGAPGPLQLRGEAGRQAEGFWREAESGFLVELAVPAAPADADIDFLVSGGSGAASWRTQPRLGAGWLRLLTQAGPDAFAAAGALPADTRAWLVDRVGAVLADSGPAARQVPLETSWAQRLLYRVVAGSRTAMAPAPPERVLRWQDGVAQEALAGQAAAAWSQDPDTAVLRNTVAVPVRIDGETRGALLLQSEAEGLLLLTNRALGRLLLTTLVVSFGLAGGLWYFATRLSRRVLRLSGAVSAAMEQGSGMGLLPLTSDRDELGQLARNNQKLLLAIADYNQYLQTLAGRLSHELHTPLAITRSSLENLASQPLDDASREFLRRAREGVERQSAIVRAMSEASRLEAAIRVAEWVEIDLVELLQRCAEGYRAIHAGRRIDTDLPPGPALLRCAPELLAQALDKLVDNAVSLSGAQDRVTLRLEPAGAGWCIGVRNTGTRLPEGMQHRLFDSLVSLRPHGGASPHLGLGLHIVRLVATAHGGSVAARNLPGEEGVEISIELPGRAPAG